MHGKRKIVVIIDDELSDIILYEQAIVDAKLNCTIKVFHEGLSAYHYIQEYAQDINLIICDIKMPRMNGLELLEKINEDHPLKMLSIPFIFFSNSASEQEIESAYSLAAQGYFQKPKSYADLVEYLLRIIRYWEITRLPKQVPISE